jgi:hypothetical protein
MKPQNGTEHKLRKRAGSRVMEKRMNLDVVVWLYHDGEESTGRL